jgi:hypothetical protein
VRTTDPAAASDFAGLAADLDAAWNAPGVTMRARQRLLRVLVTDIIADVDEAAREVVLTIHWRGGHLHPQLHHDRAAGSGLSFAFQPQLRSTSAVQFREILSL